MGYVQGPISFILTCILLECMIEGHALLKSSFVPGLVRLYSKLNKLAANLPFFFFFFKYAGKLPQTLNESFFISFILCFQDVFFFCNPSEGHFIRSRRSRSLWFLYPSQNVGNWKSLQVGEWRRSQWLASLRCVGFVQDNFFPIGRTEHTNGFYSLVDFLWGNFHFRKECP